MKSLTHRLFLFGIALLGLAAAAPRATADDQVQKLVAVLRGDAPQLEKIRACQQLAAMGSKDAVPALAALLPDEKLSVYARAALEVTPDPAADEALRSALKSLHGDQRIGAINSLAVRRDAAAVGPLAKIVQDRSTGALEALVALGHIANPAAIEVLRHTLADGPSELQPAAADGCLIAADRQFAAGQPDIALPLYDAVRHATVPRQFQLAGLHGALVTGESTDLLLEQLRSDHPDSFRMALTAIRQLPGAAITAALVAELPRARPPVQALLIPALVARKDGTILPAIEAMAGSPSPDVRMAALHGLGQIGGPSSVPILLKAIATPGTPAEADAAAASLILQRTPETDGLILQAVPTAAPGVRVVLMTILDKRNATTAVDELLRQAQQPDPEVSKAAFGALMYLARPEDFSKVLQLCIAVKNDAVRQRAEQAAFITCRKVEGDTTRSRMVLAALPGATTPAARCSLLRILGGIGNYPSYQALKSALNDDDRQIRDTAVSVLSNWLDPTPTQVLLAAATNPSKPINRMAALGGAVRLATMAATDGQTPSAQAIAWFAQASKAATTVDEKRLVLSGLGQLRCAEGLQLVEPYLTEPQLKAEAALALSQIGPRPTPTDQQAVDMTKLIFHPLFDGHTFDGWEGDTSRSFRIEDGAIVGGTTRNTIPRNEFLCTTRSYTNFVLRAESKLLGDANGGIQIRTHRIPNCREVSGYQADMDARPGGGYWGSLYDESRRGPLAAPDPARLVKIVKPGDWNTYEIRCNGPRIQLFLNGTLTVDYTEKDPEIPLGGIIALQIHAGQPSETRYRNITIAPLP
jgi:HEAT repeat protein